MRLCPQCASPCENAHKFCPSCGFPIGKIATDSDDPLVGRSLPGGYVILELIGIGGMGRVYRAEQTTLGRTVVVKIVHPHLAGEEVAARFITEARAASRLNHPNSVAIIDFGKSNDGQLYIVMEYLRGKDLARLAFEEGPLPYRRIVDILRQVLAALAEAHHLEIIHRDLKPENVIVEPMRSGGDFVKVVDFGLAKMHAEAAVPSITSPGIVCGTPEYMSPEQGRGDPIDARSDLYAVGIILFRLLTGKLPFEGDSPTQVVLARLTQPPPDPRDVAPERNIPAALARVTLKALARDPADRYRDADSMSNALALALAESEDRVGVRAFTESAARCPSCGALNARGQKFCGECGAPAAPPSALPISSRSRLLLSQLPTEPPPPYLSLSVPPTSAESIPPPNDAISWPLPLLGREEDLAWLEARRADARHGVVGARIVGDAGTGKTRLLREFRARALAEGDLVVEVGPDPAWAEVGYHALRRAIPQLLGLDDGTVPDATSAPPFVQQGLRDIFGARGSANGADDRLPEQRRAVVADALRWALTRANALASGRRVLLIVDDLHAVDGASRNAFADVLAEPPEASALILASYVPEYDPGWPASAAAARLLTGIPVREVTEHLAKGGRSPSALSLHDGRVIAPLLLEQLLRFGREQGGSAPMRLADIIALRIERLPAGARRVLQAVAIWGDDANRGTLLRLLPDEEATLEGALDYLCRAGMLERCEDTVRTSHPLLREVVLATIPAAVRRGLHEAAAAVCEEQDAPREVRALHELHAQNAFQALVLLEQVSADCAARGDGAGTVLALRRALDLARRELVRGELDDPMRAVLIFGRKLGEALARGGKFADAEGVLREALDVAGPSGPDRARVLGVLAHVAHGRHRRQEAQSYLREALELAYRSGARDLVSSLEQLKRAM